MTASYKDVDVLAVTIRRYVKEADLESLVTEIRLIEENTMNSSVRETLRRLRIKIGDTK